MNAFFGITIALVVLICSIVTLTTVWNKAKTAQEYFDKAWEKADAKSKTVGSGGPTFNELIEGARELIAIIAGRLEEEGDDGTTIVMSPKNKDDAQGLVSKGHLATTTTCWMFIVLSIVFGIYNIYTVIKTDKKSAQHSYT
jgi:hypothetical protein